MASYLPTLKISTRIFFSFAALIAMLVLLSWVYQSSLQRAARDLERAARTSANANAILGIERNVIELQRSVLAYTFSGYEGLVDRVTRTETELAGQLELVATVLVSDQEHDRYRRISEHFSQYKENFRNAIEERRLRENLVRNDIDDIGQTITEHLATLHRRALDQARYHQAAFIGLAQQSFQLTHRAVSRFFVEPDSALVREAHARMADFIAGLEDFGDIREADPAGAMPQLQQLAARYQRAFILAVQATRTYLHLVYVVMAGEAAEIGYLAKELKDLALQKQRQVAEEMALNVADSTAFTRFISLLTIIVGGSLAWSITRHTAWPIKAMTRTLTGLAGGDMSLDIPGRGRDDEIGAMAMAAQVFKEKAIALEHASQYKSEFLANMSHELRTPLNSLLILARLFVNNREGNLSPTQLEAAGVIHDSGRDLLRLINDILDLSKVEAGRMDTLPETMLLDDFLGAMEQQFRHIADSRGLALRTSTDRPGDRRLTSDWGKVEQIVRNLMSNALKFTAEGEILLSIHAPHGHARFINPRLTQRNCLAISVQDTGIGIPEDKREQIFEAFRQVDGTTSRRYGGTGLGLSISRKFAQLLGGEIQVDSEPGKGSCFSLYLPLDCPLQNADRALLRPARATLKPPPTLRDTGARILVVDDDARNRFALREILQPHVSDIIEAEDGKQALDLLEQLQPTPDILLLDIMMPVMDGYQAMRAIRGQQRFRDLPILALTARVMPGDRERCLAAGANDYLAKPVVPEQLFSMLQTWLDRHANDAPRHGAADSGPESSTPPSATDPPVQPVPQPLHGRKLLLVDADLPAGFALAQTLEQQGATVRIAEDGTRGLQRLRAEPDIAALLFALRSSLQAPCAFEALRDDPQTPHIPLITLGDAGDPEQRDRCLRSGAARHLVRPLQPATLVRAINDSLARQTAPDAAQDGGEPPRATQTAPPAAMPARQKA